MSRYWCVLTVLLGSTLWASDGGSLLGTITDPTGKAVPDAKITAMETATAVKQTVTTDARGFYSFQSLAVGRYDVEADASGFKSLRRTGVVIDVDRKIVVDASLAIGERTDAVTVSGSAVHVDTADTQMGEVITGKQMTAVPLNGRSFTDLLALQSGVVPVTSLTSQTQQDVGVSAFSPSGDLNPGTISINGQREFANSFVREWKRCSKRTSTWVPRSSPTSIPSPSSAFSPVTSMRNMASSAEGRSTWSPSPEPMPSTAMPSNFSAIRIWMPATIFRPRAELSVRISSEEPAAVPIRRNKVFFFADYQGTRSTQGIDTGQIPVPSMQDRTGNLSDVASSLMGTVTGPNLAQLLTQKLGYGVTAGEPYYFPGCTSPAQCVLPNAMIPQAAWSAPAANLLKYIPVPNNANSTFSTSAYNETLQDDKGAARLDGNYALGGCCPAYYFDGPPAPR